jgi:hypothetical protein
MKKKKNIREIFMTFIKCFMKFRQLEFYEISGKFIKYLMTVHEIFHEISWNFINLSFMKFHEIRFRQGLNTPADTEGLVTFYWHQWTNPGQGYSTISSFGYDFSHLGVQFQIRLVTGVVQSQLRQVYRVVQFQLHQIYRVVQFHIRQYLTILLHLLTFHRPKK